MHVSPWWAALTVWGVVNAVNVLRLIVEFSDGIEHPLACFVRHHTGAVEHIRHSSNRYASPLRNLFNRCLHGETVKR